MTQHKVFARDPVTGEVRRCADTLEYARLRLREGWLPADHAAFREYIAERLERIQARNKARLERIQARNKALRRASAL